jgi:hypothetical protein
MVFDPLCQPRTADAKVYGCLADAYRTYKTKQRLISEFSYAAKSWPHERRVITRLEHGEQGNNPRFVVTNLTGPAEQLYDQLYCHRGEAENRIKEAQLDLFGTRASCSPRRRASWSTSGLTATDSSRCRTVVSSANHVDPQLLPTPATTMQR